MRTMTEQQTNTAREIRADLEAAGHIAKLDEKLIRVAACLSVEVDELQGIVNSEGFTCVSHTGNLHPRPEVKMLQESRAKLVVVLKELGMTPASRRRLDVDIQHDDPLDQLRARME